MTDRTTCSTRRAGSGWAGGISPELSLQGKAFGYTRTQIDASAYRSVTDGVVLAGRTRLGTIFGRAARRRSRRRGASTRAAVRRCAAMAIQSIGPRDPNNDPIGGRSLAEFALEARVKAFGNFGVVPFLDARQHLHRGAAGLHRAALRRRAGRALLLELRADPRRCRHADQPAAGRYARRRLRVAGTGVLSAGVRRIALALLGAGGARRVGAGWSCDTGPGHRWVADRIAGVQTGNGLRFAVGRIDGSLYGRARLLRRARLRPRRAALPRTERDARLAAVGVVRQPAGDPRAGDRARRRCSMRRGPGRPDASGRSCPRSTSRSGGWRSTGWCSPNRCSGASGWGGSRDGRTSAAGAR